MLRRPLLRSALAYGAYATCLSRETTPLQAPSFVAASSLQGIPSLSSSKISMLSSAPLWCPSRHVHTVTTAANFDVEVIQSQQAICVVYYIPNNSGCTAYLRTAEKLVDELNAETADVMDDLQDETAGSASEDEGIVVDEAAGRIASNQPEGAVIEVDLGEPSGTSHNSSKTKGKRKANDWLKLCTINADENRNLASAFSVERAKLPMTYFIMQGTIIDKVVGHISEIRLKSILYNFLAHYQKQMNVDLMAKSATRYGASGGTASPLPSAEKTDLLQAGASSQFIKDKIFASLVGSEMISLPEEASHLDGLRKLVQDGKKKAHAELQDLYKQLGMDVRRLSDSEMHKHYYGSKQFTTMGVISALEALFLAREYAFIGDISRDNVEWARRGVLKDFEPILGHAEMRKVLALVDANALRGELQLSVRSLTVEMQNIVSSLQAMQAHDGPAAAGLGQDSSAPNPSARLQQRFESLQEQLDSAQRLLKVINENIDARVLEAAFPSAVVEELFTELKANLKKSRTGHAAGSSTTATSSARKEDGRMDTVAAGERAQQLKTLLMCIMQLYPTDAKSQMARSRLSSLIF